jgi:hypothetical protein
VVDCFEKVELGVVAEQPRVALDRVGGLQFAVAPLLLLAVGGGGCGTGGPG